VVGRPTKSGEPGDLPEFKAFSLGCLQVKVTGSVCLLLNCFTTTRPDVFGHQGRGAILSYICIVLFFAVAPFSCSKYSHETSSVPQRIVSLAPSITETLFSLGLSKKIVGVTTYCVYPPEAKTIEKIGSYVEINLEKILLLKPDLIILQREHEHVRLFFNNYDVQTLIVDYSSIAAMCSTFSKIGYLCGVQREADSLIEIFKPVESSHESGTDAPRVLLCVGRNAPGSGDIAGVFIAGQSTFYNDLITGAGGRNVYTKDLPEYPQLSKEGVIALSPDVIIDIASSMTKDRCDPLIGDWSSVVMVPAVRRGEVHCIAQDYATIPGPRTILLLNDLKEILHQVSNRKNP
jgi:iron complex transport system substrate-binding protein